MGFRFSVSRVYDASPDTLFEALTSARRIARWSGQKGSVSSRIGGNFVMFDGWVRGTVLAFEPGKALSYTWRPENWGGKTQDSVVTYGFVKKGKRTLLRISHKDLPSKKESDDHKAGWKEHVLDPLSDYLGTLK